MGSSGFYEKTGVFLIAGGAFSLQSLNAFLPPKLPPLSLGNAQIQPSLGPSPQVPILVVSHWLKANLAPSFPPPHRTFCLPNFRHSWLVLPNVYAVGSENRATIDKPNWEFGATHLLDEIGGFWGLTAVL
jgi:hypothetical protein